MQVSVGAAESHDEEVCIVLVTFHVQVGHLDACNLLCTQTCHQVVVLGIGADGTRLVVLLQSAKDVGETLATRHSPVTCTILGTHVGSPSAAQFLGHIRRVDGRIFLQLRELEGTAAVGDEGICQQHHGCHVFQGHLGGLVGGIEAVCGRECSHHRHRALTVAAEEHLQQVGLFRLRGQTRGRAAALHIQNHQRQLHDHCQVHGLALQADTGTRGGSDGQCSGKAGTHGRGAARDLVLALHGLHAQTLVLGQLVKHIGGGSDGIGAQVELEAGFLGSGDEAVGRSLVASNIHITPGFLLSGLDTIDVHRSRVRVVTIVITSLDHLDVGLGNGGLLGELLAQEVEGHVQVAAEEPADQTQGEHVAAL